ncbi:retrovirus-related pol polyprotein from transposon TNT 1-94 [Tanacetum coccineum]
MTISSNSLMLSFEEGRVNSPGSSIFADTSPWINANLFLPRSKLSIDGLDSSICCVPIPIPVCSWLVLEWLASLKHVLTSFIEVEGLQRSNVSFHQALDLMYKLDEAARVRSSNNAQDSLGFCHEAYHRPIGQCKSLKRVHASERDVGFKTLQDILRVTAAQRENRKWLLKALEDSPYVFRNNTTTGSTIPRFAKSRGSSRKMTYVLMMRKKEHMNMILLSIPNEIYNFVDSCKTAKEMWDRVKRLMRGTIQNQVDKETRFTNEFDQFVAELGESLVFSLQLFCSLMNVLERNNMKFPTVSVNTKFLNSLQPEWLKYLTQVRLAKQLIVDSFDDLFDYLSQFEKLNNIRAYVQGEVVEGMNATNETANVQRIVRTPTPGNTSMGQCYNCGGKGHYARNYPKPRVRDSKYFMEQMLLAKQDEAGVILTDEQNDFLFADASRMEEIEELSANICFNGQNSTRLTNDYDDEPKL